MMMNTSKLLAVALFAGAPLLAGPVTAAPLGQSLMFNDAATSNDAAPMVQQVQFRRGWRGGWRGRGWGSGIGPGIALGILGGAAIAASRPWYGNGYGPGYAYGPGYEYEPSYSYEPGYGAPGGDPAYCQQRFRSYDPRSGTYLGYDGYRHPCP
jgi:BA14K-like protein